MSVFPSPAADDRADVIALQKKLETLTDPDKPPVLIEIATSLCLKSPQEALPNALEALRLAQAYDQTWSVIRARMIAGECYFRLKHYDRSEEHLNFNQKALKALLLSPLALLHREKLFKALSQNSQLAADSCQANQKYSRALAYYLDALTFHQKLAEPGSAASLLYRIGKVCLLMSDNQKALAYAADSLKEAEKAGATDQIALSSHLLGLIHRNLNRLPEALAHFGKALDIATQTADKSQICLTLNEMGQVLTIQKKFSQALAYRQQALEVARQTNNAENISTILRDFAYTYLEMNRPEAALPLLRDSYELNKAPARAQEIAVLVNRLASADMDRQDNRRALRLLLGYLPLVEKARLRKETLDIYVRLSDLYRRLGSAGMSNLYLRQAYDFREKLYEDEKDRLTRDLQTKYETDKKQKENDLLKHELRIKALDLRQSSLQISFLLALSALVLLIALILYNRYRFRLKAHRELEQANLQIQEKQVELTKANRRLDELTREDPLTSLANRRELLSRFEQEKIRFNRSGRTFALIMADLDNFKTFNDRYGHNCGDDILKTLASLLRSMIRGQDIVGRWGGDEFLILLPETGLSGGETVAKKVQARIRRTAFYWKDMKLKVKLSLGVSIYKKGMDFDDCLKSADLVMLRRKRMGRSAPPPA